MADGRSNRKSKVVAFIDRLSKDRANNFNVLLSKAKMLELEGFGEVDWESNTWKITSGRLIKQTGKKSKSSSFNFMLSPALGRGPIDGEWTDLVKTLFILRFHRKYQVASNQRYFINAFGYVSNAATLLNQNVQTLTPEALDKACKNITEHYSNTTAYNLHKHVAEIAGHFDANGLCRIILKYKYSRMKRPDNVGGVNHKRLDDPKSLESKSDKLIDPHVFKVLGELYQKVPKNHKYRFYILMLTLLACLGRRFAEISLLPYQQIKVDFDGRNYLEYFPRKMSQGDIFTPKRKLFMPSAVLPIVREVINELDEHCSSARETAAEMHQRKAADIRFLSGQVANKRFYKEDLQALNIPVGILSSHGWLGKNGYTFSDHYRKSKNGTKPTYPIKYTNKEGLIAYFNKDFSIEMIAEIHKDQSGKVYFLKDLMFVKYLGSSSGNYTYWLATECTHSMLTTFIRYMPDLIKEYASTNIKVDFTSHHFRHTLNTLLDEGGLSDLLQTEWFGRSNPKDTKTYQHTSREKRTLMLRQDIKKGSAGGKFVNQVLALPISMQDAVLSARVQAVHDVGAGICIHNFSQTPCERNLQCSADCDDYVWIKDDKGRLNEQKRQLALNKLARKTAQERLEHAKPKKSSDWLLHNEKKINTLKQQLKDNGVSSFDYEAYLEELTNGK